ncbi:gliding motility protein MglA [hydrothermal vent metagenome]|uniref:Gliding motility protein MglA n=1 Tax=hydrothermal vent metagenome TaxID=652676 RepID=A0A3B1C7Y2_9ZZZZ
MQINYAKKLISCKLVYYGPGMSGKTTNLELIHQKVPDENKGEMTSIATEGDRTLFFDFLPLDLGEVRGMTTKFQLYTVPGQIYYASTRKLVLQGADGIIFVADSQEEKLEENLESLQDLADNLKEYGIKVTEIPFVIQWNKRDLPTAMPVEELEEKVNWPKAATTTAVAATGEGVLQTLKLAASLVLDRLNTNVAPGAAATTQASEPTTEEKKPEIYVAKVNQDSISKAYFSQYCQSQHRINAKSDAVEDFKKFSREEKKKLLESLVNYVLLLQDAKKRNIQASKKEIESQLSSFTKRFGSKEKLDEYLKNRKITLDALRNEATKNIIIGKIIFEIIPDINERLKISEGEIQKFYDSNKDKMGGNPLEKVKKDIKSHLKNVRKRKLLGEFHEKLKEQAQIKIFEDKL